MYSCGAVTANERPTCALSLYGWDKRRLSLCERSARDGWYGCSNSARYGGARPLGDL